MTDFLKLPSRIRNYLLEWKDDNLEDYIRKFGELKLKDMTWDQLRGLFDYASKKEDSLCFNNKSIIK